MNVNFKPSIGQGKSLRFSKSNDGKKTLLRPINLPQISISETDNIALLMHLNGADGSTIFNDFSFNEIPLTGFANMIISTGEYKFGGASAKFETAPSANTRNYIGSDNSSAFNFVSGAPWTFECWVNPTSLPPDNRSVIFSNCRMDSAGVNYEFYLKPTGSIQANKIYLNDELFETGEVPLNTWTHVAFSYDGNLTRGFINGVKAGEKNIHINVTNTNNRIMFGANKYVGIYERSHLVGYMDEIRITTGVARYINNFTTPTQQFPDVLPDIDQYINNVSLLMHMDGTSESQSFVDSSINNLISTAFSSAQISTDIKKFGTGSALFDGIGDYLKINSNSVFALGNNFTIEAWVYPTSMSSDDLTTIVDLRDFGTQQGTALFLDSSTRKGFLYDGPANGALISNTTVSLNTWTHIAAVRNGTTWQIYINGVLDTATYTSSSNLNDARACFIGTAADNPGGFRNFIGYIDELRITKGIARYTSTFTSPTEPFPNP